MATSDTVLQAKLKKEADAKAAAKEQRAAEFMANAKVDELPNWHPDVVDERFAEAVQGADIELLATAFRKVANSMRSGKDFPRALDAVAEELEEIAEKAEGASATKSVRLDASDV